MGKGVLRYGANTGQVGKSVRYDPESGIFKIVNGADPNAGSDATDTIPAGKAWKLLSYHIQLVTDATAANRFVAMLITDSADVILSGGAHFGAHVASITMEHIFAAGLGSATYSAAPTNGVVQTGALPYGAEYVLPAGWKIKTKTAGIVAGDNFGVPHITVIEFDLLS